MIFIKFWNIPDSFALKNFRQAIDYRSVLSSDDFSPYTFLI